MIKGQALVDFLTEFYNLPNEEELPQEDAWIACVDGSSTWKRSGAGVMLTRFEGEKIESAIQLRFNATNNEAKYEAVIAGLNMAWEVGAKNFEI